jgi:hypothetical protein
MGGFRSGCGKGNKLSDIKRSKKHVVDNKKFIDLMRVACEKPDVRKKLKIILNLDSFNRKSVLNTWLRDLKLQGAPNDFIEALSFFLDDAIAEKALEVILESEA